MSESTSLSLPPLSFLPSFIQIYIYKIEIVLMEDFMYVIYLF